MKLWERIRRWLRRDEGAAGETRGTPEKGATAESQVTQPSSASPATAEEFEREFVGELFEIEAAIMRVYSEEEALTDHQVDCALEAVLDALKAREIGRAPRQFNLLPREQKVYEYVLEACEVVGGAPPRYKERLLNPFPLKKRTPQDVMNCIKRVRKSVHHWSKQGPQAYLDTVARHFMRIYRTLQRAERE